MHVNLDQPPSTQWQLCVTFRGTLFSTRPLTREELGAAQQLLAGKPLKPAVIRSLLDSLFVGDKPDIAMWPVESLLSVLVAAIMEYFRATTAIAHQAVNVKKFGGL